MAYDSIHQLPNRSIDFEAFASKSVPSAETASTLPATASSFVTERVSVVVAALGASDASAAATLACSDASICAVLKVATWH